MRKIFVLGLFITVICSTTLWAQGPPVPTAERPLPEGPAKAIVQKACVTCHLINFITTAQHPAAEWKLLVERMEASSELQKSFGSRRRSSGDWGN